MFPTLMSKTALLDTLCNMNYHANFLYNASQLNQVFKLNIGLKWTLADALFLQIGIWLIQNSHIKTHGNNGQNMFKSPSSGYLSELTKVA